jgi:4-amino-4-deoxy-L-arabinose transferase-like glycosyltransferase
MKTTVNTSGPHNTDPAPGAVLRPHARWLVALLLAWAGVIVALYFRRLWPQLTGADGPWTWPQVGQALRHTGLPHAREAALRAGAAIAAAAVCSVAIFGLGVLVVRAFAPSTTSAGERLMLRLTFGAGTLGCLLYGLAELGLYTAPVVRALVMTLAAAACVLAVIGARRVRAPRLAIIPRRDWPWMAIAVGAVLYAGFCALAPEIEYDALWYHLELPRRWLTAGHPVDDVNEYVSLYPLGWDLLFGAALTLDGPVAAKLLHWLALPACGLVAGLLTRLLSARASAWMAAAIVVTAPTMFWEGTTAYVDLALALYLAVAAYALLRAHETGERRWLIVAGLQLGFACAAKHLGLVALAGIAPVLAWSCLWGAARVGKSEASDRAARLRAAAEALLVVTVLAVLVPLPWYVRAWRASGNPVFPDMYRTFGAQPPERWDRLTERGLQKFKDHFGRPRTAVNVVLLPWDVTMHAAQYGGALGPLPLAGFPIMLLAAARRRAALALLASSAIYVAVWASPLGSYQLRFLLPVWVPCAALLAVGIHAVLGSLRSRAARAGVRAGLGAVLLASLPPWTFLQEPDRHMWDGWLTQVTHEPPTAVVLGGIGQDEWLRGQIRTYGAWHWLNTHAPEGTRVLTFFSGDQLYSARARVWSEAVNARAATWGATAADRVAVQQALQGLGIDYVLAPSDPFRTDEHRRLDVLRPEVMGGALERVYEDRWTVIYAVRTDAGDTAGAIDHS